LTDENHGDKRSSLVAVRVVVSVTDVELRNVDDFIGVVGRGEKGFEVLRSIGCVVELGSPLVIQWVSEDVPVIKSLSWVRLLPSRPAPDQAAQGSGRRLDADSRDHVLDKPFAMKC
jgi:hypothetical protein